ncbi:response regulator transcription factor [Streptomyces sp. NPDC004111]|uniref:response regulator transcription factor n=1 Tax=Streptomyces sp. NPDC004111 TaxID=3364690 RepID=UPI0036AD08D3
MSHTAPPRLSARELQILRLLLDGSTYPAIAHHLRLSPHTVDTYLRRIRAKTGASNQFQLAVVACRIHGLPDEAPGLTVTAGTGAPGRIPTG